MENDDQKQKLPYIRQTCFHSPKVSIYLAGIIITLAVLSCLLGYCIPSETLPYESTTLRLVVILFRHGARNPTRTYNSDPHRNYPWPGGFGSLTNVGKLQMYELGKKYRSHYANFVPDEYHERYVYVRSSDKSRCIMSAYTFLAGLYPPSKRQMWHPEIPWQPIPVHSLPFEIDNILAETKPCKLWKEMHKEIMAEKDADPKHVEIFDYLSKHTNQSIRSILNMHYLYDTLFNEQEAGLQLPDWTKSVFPEKMSAHKLSMSLLCYNESLQRLQVGPLLSEIKHHFEDTVSHGNVERILYVYSGHDVNVVSLWRAFRFDELLEPEYGASFTLELHEDVEQEFFFVKAFYRNNTKVDGPLELKLPFCDDPCTYNQFKDHIDNFIPYDWEAECQNIF